MRRIRSISGVDERRKRAPAARETTDRNLLKNVGQERVLIGADLVPYHVGFRASSNKLAMLCHGRAFDAYPQPAPSNDGSTDLVFAR